MPKTQTIGMVEVDSRRRISLGRIARNLGNGLDPGDRFFVELSSDGVICLVPVGVVQKTKRKDHR